MPSVQEHPLGTGTGQDAEDGSRVLDAGSKKWRDVLLLFRLGGLLGALDNSGELMCDGRSPLQERECATRECVAVGSRGV